MPAPAAAAKQKDTSGAKYTEEDLRGLKVRHSMDAFQFGEERVLTLKDKRILDDDGAAPDRQARHGRGTGRLTPFGAPASQMASIEDDELVNAELLEKQKLEQNLENKRRGGVAYRAYDDEEFGPDGRTKGEVLK